MGMEMPTTGDEKFRKMGLRSQEIVGQLNEVKRDRYAKEDQMNNEKDETVKAALKSELLELDAKIDKLATEQNSITREINEG